MNDVWMFRGDGDGVPHRRDRDCAATCHPVALVDPEGPSANRLRDAMGTRFSGVMSELRGILREFADPKPEEPTGLGAVVEAINDNHFVRVGSAGWVHVDDHGGNPCNWEDIAAVRVLSEGVQA